MEGMEVQPHISLRKGQVEPVCIIVGDPARTEAVANLCEKKRELTFCREFRSFSVEYDGQPLTVISHGIGAPGTAICCEELIHLGAKVLIRAGTCGSLRPDLLKQGDLFVPYAAANDSGYVANTMPPGFPCVCTPDVFQAIVEASKECLGKDVPTGIILTQDQFYQSAILPSKLDLWSKVCDAVEMEMSAVCTVAHARRVASGGIFTVDGSPLFWKEGDYDSSGEKTATGKRNMLKVALKAAASLRRKFPSHSGHTSASSQE
ncbi:purine nucleoside phosphorylase [Cystoisospora suis]|uniref:Purine nucleoside phosphorylase n=1 Tax=Cystoisospora suis TaxID=483139 RepID=A0A2C6KQL5_9APIC|nr:purine nucleoside phosphorylase [Cystoisospora suis]